jgi:hypothetical protein
MLQLAESGELYDFELFDAWNFDDLASAQEDRLPRVFVDETFEIECE